MSDRQPTSRHCFICGRENPTGLHMHFNNDREAGQVWAEVVVPETFNGYPGVVHGGIVAAILDETAGRAVLVDGDDNNLMVTLKLEIRYRHPTPTDTLLRAVGWVVRPGSRRAEVAGELRLPDGSVSAECRAILARPPESVFEEWEQEKPYWGVFEEG